MKTLSTISGAAVLATTFAIPAWAGPVGVSRTPNSTPQKTTTIAELQDAAQQAQREGRTGNKNNIEFARKNYEISSSNASRADSKSIQQTSTN